MVPSSSVVSPSFYILRSTDVLWVANAVEFLTGLLHLTEQRLRDRVLNRSELLAIGSHWLTLNWSVYCFTVVSYASAGNMNIGWCRYYSARRCDIANVNLKRGIQKKLLLRRLYRLGTILFLVSNFSLKKINLRKTRGEVNQMVNFLHDDDQDGICTARGGALRGCFFVFK